MLARSPFARLRAFLHELGGQATLLYEEDPAVAQLTRVSDLPWSSRLQRGFKFSEIYSHQLQSYQLLRDGQHVIITTPTASGKTGAFFPAIFERLEQDPRATALFVYPLVALGQDQRDKLLQFKENGEFTWDIGTFQESANATEVFRANVRMVTATPDKLQWALTQPTVQQFLQNLQFVVLDEAHTYRGGFGCEVTGLIRRLLKLAHEFGTRPQVVLSTATIGNPCEFARELTGLDMTEISVSGAQKHGKQYYLTDHKGRPKHFWDAVVSASYTQRMKVLVFLRGRSKAMRMHTTYSNHRLYRDHVHLYMAGTGSRESRLAEFRQAKSGVMFATNALEAGVDIGDLEVVIIDGYPGSRMSFRQMAGRAGRVSRGLVVYIPALNAEGLPQPVDAFYSNRGNFRELLTGPLEKAVVEADNPFIAPKHASRGEYELFRAGFRAPVATPKWWSLRGEGSPKFAVIEEHVWEKYGVAALQSPLESPSQHYAYIEKHPEAIFSLDGQSYFVIRWEPTKDCTAILCKTISSDTQFTRGIHHTTVHPRAMSEWIRLGPLAYCHGTVQVRREYTGYMMMRQVFERVCSQCDALPTAYERVCAKCGGRIKDKMQDQKVAEYSYDRPVELPPLETTALKIGIDAAVVEHADAVAHTLKHLLQKVIPEQVVCDEGDLAGAFHKNRDNFFYIYDDWKGGLGLTKKVTEALDSLLTRAAQLCHKSCCQDGCYECIEVSRCFAPYMASKNDSENIVRRPIHKQATAEFLRRVLTFTPAFTSTLGVSVPAETVVTSDMATTTIAGQDITSEIPTSAMVASESEPIVQIVQEGERTRNTKLARLAGLAASSSSQVESAHESIQIEEPLKSMTSDVTTSQTRTHTQSGDTPYPPPEVSWPFQARELLDLYGLTLPEISARLGVPSREIQRAVANTPTIRLRHPKFGEGILLQGYYQGDRREILVHFPDVGNKKLLLSYANIEVVKDSSA